MTETRPLLTEIECRALSLLVRPMTCTELGEVLWPTRRFANRQAWARPAGKVIKRLSRLDLVRGFHDGHHFRYVARNILNTPAEAV